MRKAWMPSASPSATATMRTSSSSEPEADEALGNSGRGVVGAGGGRLGGVRLRRLVERLRVDGLARHLGVRGGCALGRGIVQQPGLDDLLRLPGVATLAHPGALADAAAQVVELRPAHVAAGGDLDALDLRRVQRERPLHADTEGLLAHGEGLAHALALTLDDDTFEDLRAAPRALDDQEVHLHAVACLEAGDTAQLRALEGVDDSAHGERGIRRLRSAPEAAAYASGPPARRRLCCRRPCRICSWWPEARTSGTRPPRQSARRGECGSSGPPSSAGLKDSSAAESAWPSEPGSLRRTVSATTIAASSPPAST